MNENKDIGSIEDIRKLVDSFYSRLREDELLGPIFKQVIGDKWAIHLEKMYRFWQTVLLEEHTYNGRPFPPHANLPIAAEHFDRWLENWKLTVDQFFAGPIADEAKWRADKMAVVFLSKIEYFRYNGGRSLF